MKSWLLGCERFWIFDRREAREGEEERVGEVGVVGVF